MMGHQQVEQAALFYEFSLERHIPTNHLLWSIDRFVSTASAADISPLLCDLTTEEAVNCAASARPVPPPTP